MIKIIFLVLSLSVSSLASEANKQLSKDLTFSCVVTSDNKRYDDIFIVEASAKGLSQIKYKRRYSCDSGGKYGPLETIRGCAHANIVKVEENIISMECDRDGEEGSFDINPITLTGEFYFYMPQIGYGERTELEVKCEKIEN